MKMTELIMMTTMTAMMRMTVVMIEGTVIMSSVPMMFVILAVTRPGPAVHVIELNCM